MSGAIDTLQPAGCYDELVELIDDVRIARGLSFDQLEDLGGIARNHAQKALGPARVKPLSRMLLDALLPTLGVRIALVDDPEAIASMQQNGSRGTRATCVPICGDAANAFWIEPGRFSSGSSPQASPRQLQLPAKI